MTAFFRRSCGAMIAYAVATHGAWAELSADDVWADWQAYLGGMGYQVAGETSSSGAVMTIDNMTMSMDLPEEDGRFSMSIPSMTLTENEDGSVTVGFPPSFPMVIDGNTEGEEFRAELTYTHDGLNMVISGSPEDVTYDYSAASVGVALTSVEADGAKLPPEAIVAAMDMVNVAGKSHMRIGEMRELDQSMTADSLTYNVAFDDPESEDQGKFKGTMNGLSFEGTGTIPKEFDPANYNSLVESGFDFDGKFTFASGSGEVAGTGDGEQFEMSSQSEGGDFAIAMDAAHIGYDIAQKGVKIAVSTADLPFPIELAMASAGIKFDIPVQASDEVQPFAFAMNLTDFTMSDILWGMFDPAGALPRDPATIALDASGTAKIKVNFLDPAVAEMLDATDAAPGELHSLKINELIVSLIGAKLTGNGDFKFDNSNLAAFNGVPAPSGEANLQLVGANALIDKLIGMGIVSDEDAMGARMMMGLFAVPGDAPDTLKSKIEINEQGHVSANGQRIK